MFLSVHTANAAEQSMQRMKVIMFMVPGGIYQKTMTRRKEEHKHFTLYVKAFVYFKLLDFYSCSLWKCCFSSFSRTFVVFHCFYKCNRSSKARNLELDLYTQMEIRLCFSSVSASVCLARVVAHELLLNCIKFAMSGVHSELRVQVFAYIPAHVSTLMA